MDARFSTEVHHREEQVSKLGLQGGVPLVVDRRTLRRPFDRVITELRAHLAELFVHLRRRPVHVRPVEAHAGRTVLEAVRPMK